MTSKNRREIGDWGLIKNEIVEKYAHVYTTIVTKHRLHATYVDVFAGSPQNMLRTTGEVVDGSATRALKVVPAFDSYLFVDSDASKVEDLNALAVGRNDVQVFHGDGNEILRDSILPTIKWELYRRALVLLDPYGMGVAWDVVERLGRSRCAEIILNFPMMDMNRNALRNDPARIDERAKSRMNLWWGDDSWRSAFYRRTPQLPLLEGFPDEEKRASNEDVVNAYVDRLKAVAGFGFVSEPFAVRNSINSTMYYLVFATPNEAANRIMAEILKKYGG